MIDRRNYRKVYARIWTSEDFQSLGDTPKLLALYALTGPQTNRIGFFRLSVAAAAEDLNKDVSDIEAGLDAICGAFGWGWDATAKVLWIPTWWIYNPLTEGTQNLKGYLHDLNDVPRTSLIASFCANIEHIPVSQREFLAGWEAALTPKVASPQRHIGTALHGGRGGALHAATPTDGYLAGTTCTYTETETSTETETGTQTETSAPPARSPLIAAPRLVGRAQDFVALWNATTTSPLHQCRTLTDDRKRKIRARLATHPDLEWWQPVFQRIQASPFCRGETGGRNGGAPWTADLDWIIANDTNAAKVLEGKYDQRAPPQGIGAAYSDRTAQNLANRDRLLDRMNVKS